MLGSTHSRIASRIAEELGINERRNIELLVNGSNAPDSWADFPHHQGKDQQIKENILAARRLFLQNDDECFYRLGVALHYVADRWTLRPRIVDKHTEWERIIDASPILDDLRLQQMIKESSLPSKEAENYVYSLRKLREGVNGLIVEDELENAELSKYVIYYATQERPSTWSSPVLDLNFAYRICLEIAKIVLNAPSKEIASAVEIEQRVAEFPDGYFRDDWSHTKRVHTFSKLAEVVDLTAIVNYIKLNYGNRWNDASILTFDYLFLKMEEVAIPEKVKRRVIVKKPHWLFKKKEIEKEETVEDIKEKKIFRVHLGDFYVDCASKDVAIYILESLRSIAMNPDSEVRKHAREVMWTKLGETSVRPPVSGDNQARGRGYIRWCDFVDFLIPNKTYLKKLLKEYYTDKTTLKKLKRDPSTWF